jgi:hypothetical protein
MNEEQAISYTDKLDPLQKLAYWMEYFIRYLPGRPSITFEQFCSPRMIIRHDAGNRWKEQGFASKQWINLTAGSVYHSVFHQFQPVHLK